MCIRDSFVGLPSSAIGLSGDGKVSSRATSVEAGPRSVSRPVVCSESVGQERGPVQGAENEEIRGFVGTACSDVISISTTDVRPTLHWFPYWNRARGVLLRQLRICCIERRALPAHVVCRLPVPTTTLGRFCMLAPTSRHRAHLTWLWLAPSVPKTGLVALKLGRHCPW